jgi:hypothetical protein
MGWIVGDSFDYYGNTADLARSVWDSLGNSGSFATPGAGTRFGVGQDYSVTVFDNLSKTFPSNESSVYVVCAQYRPGAQSGTQVELYFLLKDGATTQCVICFMSNGSIQLRAGSTSGTVLATYANAFSQDVWIHFQIRVVIDAAAGSFTVRKNGATTDSFSATGLATRGGTSNNYVNGLTLGLQNGYIAGHYIDDLLIFGGSGAAPNNWVGDVRALCLMPVADTAQKQSTPVPATPTTTFAPGGTFIGQTFNGNTIYWSGTAKPTRGGMLQQITVNSNGSGPPHAKLALYFNDGPSGAPGTLVAVSNEVATPASSGAISFTFPAGTFVSPFRTYYVALLTDANWGVVNFSNNSTVYTLARTYASGFPTTASGLTTLTGSVFGFTWTVTAGGSCVALNEQQATGDTDYVFDSTVGDMDLYDMDDLPVNPVQIIGVVSKLYVKKSDAGTRNAQLQVKSGATQVTGPDTVLGSTYGYLSRADAVDPNTATSWTIPGVNAVQVGHKVTA